MRGFRQFPGHDGGAVAPTVALSLFALIAAGGLAFDYARMATLDSELQNGADQAALAAASQLDRTTGSMQRATAAAQSLLTNLTFMANDTTASRSITVPTVMFYETKADAEANTNGFTDTTKFAVARFVRVAVGVRRANFALTPVVGALTSGDLPAEAVAGIDSAICKVPPVMICNPDEPSSNIDELLAFTPVPGTGLRLVTGNATVPGNFGWLESGVGNGAGALAAALGYNNPPGECQPISGVTTKTGMTTSVLSAFNTRFDVYENGNMTCPSQLNGVCSPAPNTRKDLVCDPNNAETLCKNDGWAEPANPYRPLKEDNGTGTLVEVPKVLPADGSQDPKIMGYPRDLCHAVLRNAQTCGIKGSGIWDRDAYFRVNYGLTTEAAWRAQMGLAATAPAPTRYQVYLWEIANPSVPNGSGVGNSGIGVPQKISNNEFAFSYPATGRPGAAASATQPDRRKISVAVLNCQALNAHGKTTNVPVPTWLEVFLVEPAFNRGSGPSAYTDQKDIYVEMVGATTASSNNAGQVVRRDVPYLIK